MTQIRTRPTPPAAVERLISQNVHPLLARLFAARGVDDMRLLDTELPGLLAPQTMRGIEAAAQLLADAIAANKKLLIVADYDCDGATACAVGLRGLRMLGAQVDYLVPDRFKFGYGLTPEIVQLATQHPRLGRPDLIVTVDNGIASVEGVQAANDAGIEVLVTDHHLPGNQLPAARVIVNPNQPGCGFASKSIAGVGVMFYVLLALRAELRTRGRFTTETQPRLDSLLDLVALGTVCDVVKLDTNNRILVTQGLKRMRAGKMQPGVAALFRAAGREARSANSFDLGFAVGPRLNAAGRLADMSLGIECLLTADEGRAFTIAQQLDQINRDRREIEADMQDTALALLEELDAEDIAMRRSITLFDPDWHQGVIGILASRIKEKYHRPTITFAPADDEGEWLKGSGRSIPGVHLRDVLDLVSKQAPQIISKFGGHAMAAGLTIHADALDEFETALEEAVQAMSAPELFTRTIDTDGALEDGYLQPQIVTLLEQQVWGQGFPAPLFCNDFRVLSQRLVKEKHLKLQLQTRSGSKVDGIWFGHTDPLPDNAQLVYRMTVDSYGGTPKISLLIEHCAE